MTRPRRGRQRRWRPGSARRAGAARPARLRLSRGRRTASRPSGVLELVDVFVWVTDPQKYADARLHDDYVAAARRPRGRDDGGAQPGRPPHAEAEAACRRDLAAARWRRRRRRRRGARHIARRPAAGSTSCGQRLGNAVAGQQCCRRGWTPTCVRWQRRLRSGVADSEPRRRDSDGREPGRRAGPRAGVPTVVDAVERDYRREAGARTGWLFTRWATALRPAPLRRLRLNGRRCPSGALDESDIRVGARPLVPAARRRRRRVRPSSSPPASWGTGPARGCRSAWAERSPTLPRRQGTTSADALDQAVVGTRLRARDPLWWRSLWRRCSGSSPWPPSLGLVWLVVLMVLGWLQLPASTLRSRAAAVPVGAAGRRAC